MHESWLWAAFIGAVAVMMAVDLGVLNKRAHPPTLKEAAVWSAIWVGLALTFGAAIWAVEGAERAMLYLTGYVLEKSLSVDNLFVFLVLFRFFKIGPEHQARVLHWGILGAIALRFVFISMGVALIHRWTYALPLFGLILLVTGGKMLFADKDDGDHQPHKSKTLHLLHKVLPVTESLHGQAFFTTVRGRLEATPLFAALVLIEASDLVFAADSIPAALAVTPDLFLVYTSNIFAVMGLRALYFLLEGSIDQFRHLKYGISFALVFIGAKLLVHQWFAVPTGWSLAVVFGSITLSIAASLADPRGRVGPPPHTFD